MAWAFSQKVERSSAKFVLVAMADCANEEMRCWPSVMYLCEATCQDRKTVLENIRRLREAGLIRYTGEKRGSTGQIPVFELNNSENGTVKEPQKRNSTENGTVPKTDEKSPVFPPKESRFSVETVPKTGHGTQREPKKEPKGNPNIGSLASDVPADVLNDFIAMRKAKNAPLSATALTGLRREAEKAGKSLADVMAICCERGWRGFKAEWIEERELGKQAAMEMRNRGIADRWASSSIGKFV